MSALDDSVEAALVGAHLMHSTRKIKIDLSAVGCVGLASCWLGCELNVNLVSVVAFVVSSVSTGNSEPTTSRYRRRIANRGRGHEGWI